MSTNTLTQPQVQPGQIWHHESGNSYEVLAIHHNKTRGDMAHCHALDTHGNPITDYYNEPLVCKFSVDSLRGLMDLTERPPFAYKRPRCPLTHLWRLIKRLLRRHSRRIARIGAQAVLSGSLIAGGITIGLNPPGAFLTFTGFCLAFPLEEEESIEEYNAEVRAHFAERGLPNWLLKLALKGGER